jgi:hypothetical protein
MTLEFLDSEPLAVDNGTLVLLGGITVLGFGLGLILGSSILRHYVYRIGVGDLASSAIPEAERYFKLRAT